MARANIQTDNDRQHIRTDVLMYRPTRECLRVLYEPDTRQPTRSEQEAQLPLTKRVSTNIALSDGAKDISIC